MTEDENCGSHRNERTDQSHSGRKENRHMKTKDRKKWQM